MIPLVGSVTEYTDQEKVLTSDLNDRSAKKGQKRNLIMLMTTRGARQYILDESNFSDEDCTC
jgi:hypothetical protein